MKEEKLDKKLYIVKELFTNIADILNVVYINNKYYVPNKALNFQYLLLLHKLKQELANSQIPEFIKIFPALPKNLAISAMEKYLNYHFIQNEILQYSSSIDDFVLNNFDGFQANYNTPVFLQEIKKVVPKLIDEHQKMCDEKKINNAQSVKEEKKNDAIKNIDSLEKKGKTTIYISEKYGIYDNEKTQQPCYEIKTSSKRFKLLLVLKSGAKSGPSLKKEIDIRGLPLLSKEIKEINKLFQKKLNYQSNIINNKADGYSLNRKMFNIVFL